MKVVATYSIKGGVGKTSAAVNVGALAARAGLRTLLWDLDPQGAATFLLRVKPKVKGGGRKLVRGTRDPGEALKGTDVEGLDLLPADFSYRHLDVLLDREERPEEGVGRVLAPLAGDYDLAILDCAPSISLVSESVFAAADVLLVPLVPSTLSVRTLEQLRTFLERHGAGDGATVPEVLAFLSMVDRRKNLHRELAASLPETFSGMARAAIPSASAVELMGARREPLVQSRPRDAAAVAYTSLWEELREVLDRG
ncbi:ParA family protein [Conexibacter sp. SYSU D00693]|uniref:ParA family protein n=1 Tax=Conexibacter sp. SYSU D00693 TaxID=2812560 RepID=UPI00196B18BA|nr:ParA family protein [Conexibacter sp. SYSU D00693]